MKQLIKEWPITLTFFLSLAASVCLILFTCISEGEFHGANILSVLTACVIWSPFLGLLFFYPLVLSVTELVLLLQYRRPFLPLSRRRGFDGITLVLGFFYSWLYLWFWNGGLSYEPRPWATVFRISPAVLALGGIGLAGYFLLSYFPGHLRIPALGALALGGLAAVLWGIQTILHWKGILDGYLLLYPIAVLLIFGRTAAETAASHTAAQTEDQEELL